MAADTWYSAEKEPAPQKIDARGWVRVVRRGLPLITLVSGGLAISTLVRLVEAPLFGMRRPWTPVITVAVCRGSLALLGITYRLEGKPAAQAGAVVANHASWLDIFALNAAQRITFVSKSEVAKWPGIGWLARATGTVFIKRDRREARDQIEVFRRRLDSGQKLLFFPEGTSTDGFQVLPFKPTLFAAFFDDVLRDRMAIQPVTVQYHAPRDADPRLYGWWGDMAFGPHLLSTLAARRQGRIVVVHHDVVQVKDYNDRKALAADLERKVRSGLPSGNEGSL